jgi:gluconate:H+ symporter, GntP family
MPDLPPLPVALAAIALLVALVTWLRVNAFLALLAAAVFAGVGCGLAPLATLKSFQEGMGATLGGIAAVIALGAMLGRLLAESGGAQVLAERLEGWFGPGRAMLCVSVLGVGVGLVTWFTVGLLLLVPVAASLARRSGRPFLLLALPMVAFLSAMHGLTPPHPGPVVAIDALGASPGAVLALAFAVGLPAAFLAGPLFARWIAPQFESAPVFPEERAGPASGRPGFAATATVIALPVGLMMLASAGELLLPAGSPARGALAFAGHPVTALVVALLLAFLVFGRAAPFSRGQLLAFTEGSVAEIGMTLLVVGAGGGFARVLREAGVADALGGLAGAASLPPLVYGWLIAAFIRVATGSATVAITTAAGLLAPVLAAHPEVNRNLMVIALGSGSLVLSHLNDGGFWIVRGCLGLSVGQTLRTWCVLETILGVAGLAFTLLLSLVL